MTSSNNMVELTVNLLRKMYGSMMKHNVPGIVNGYKNIVDIIPPSQRTF